MTKKKQPATPATEQIELGHVGTYSLAGLKVSELNARKTVDPDALLELKASIEAKGLLQSLIGHFIPDDGSTLFIVGGQRRLLALQLLEREGKLDPEARVPVRVMPDADTALEASLAENLERQDMSPVEEFRAFKQLVDTGRFDAQAIADRFGYTKRVVDARLRLNLLAPEILTALEEGKFGIEAAKAYATVTDPEAQLKVFKAQERASYQKHSPSQILDAVNAIGVDVDSKLGTFIGGEKAYLKAGGTFDESPLDDLFEQTWTKKRKRTMIDGALVNQLFLDKANAKAKALIKQASEHFGCAIAGVLWSPKPMEGTAPKVPAGSFKLAGGYMYSDSERSRFHHKIKVAADAGARVSIVGYLGHSGTLTFDKSVLFVTKDGEAAVKAIDTQAQQQAAAAQETDEQRSARQREERIKRDAAILFWNQLGEDERVARRKHTRTDFDSWRDPTGIELSFKAEVSFEESAAFIDQARTALEEYEAGEAERKAEAEAKKQAAADAFSAVWTTLSDTAAEGVEVIELVADDETTTATLSTDGWRVRYPEGEEEVLAIDVMLDVFDDYATADPFAVLTAYATTADHEAAVTGTDETPAPVEAELEPAE